MGTQNFAAPSHGQARPGTDTFSHDLIQVAHIRPTLSDELKMTILVIIRTGVDKKGLESARNQASVPLEKYLYFSLARH